MWSVSDFDDYTYPYSNTIRLSLSLFSFPFPSFFLFIPSSSSTAQPSLSLTLSLCLCGVKQTTPLPQTAAQSSSRWWAPGWIHMQALPPAPHPTAVNWAAAASRRKDKGPVQLQQLLASGSQKPHHIDEWMEGSLGVGVTEDLFLLVAHVYSFNSGLDVQFWQYAFDLSIH